MDMRISINTACALVVGELRLTGKDIFSADDIKQALTLAERGSKCSFDNYMGPNGYLIKRGFLQRVKGGWELTESSRGSGVIVIKIMPGNEYMIGEVTKSVGNVVKKYGKVVEMRTEV
jgi:hypothetical protein